MYNTILCSILLSVFVGQLKEYGLQQFCSMIPEPFQSELQSCRPQPVTETKIINTEKDRLKILDTPIAEIHPCNPDYSNVLLRTARRLSIQLRSIHHSIFPLIALSSNPQRSVLIDHLDNHLARSIKSIKNHIHTAQMVKYELNRCINALNSQKEFVATGAVKDLYRHDTDKPTMGSLTSQRVVASAEPRCHIPEFQQQVGEISQEQLQYIMDSIQQRVEDRISALQWDPMYRFLRLKNGHEIERLVGLVDKLAQFQAELFRYSQWQTRFSLLHEQNDHHFQWINQLMMDGMGMHEKRYLQFVLDEIQSELAPSFA